jgi:hypothetical protein
MVRATEQARKRTDGLSGISEIPYKMRFLDGMTTKLSP